MSIVHDFKIQIAETIKQGLDKDVRVLTFRSNFYSYPFVFIGKSNYRDWSSKTFNGVEIIQHIDVFFNNKSASQTAHLIDIIYKRMCDHDFVLSGIEIVTVEWLRTSCHNFNNYNKYSCVFKIKGILKGDESLCQPIQEN